MDPFPGSGWGGGVGKVCGQNVCYHVVTLRDSLQFDVQHDIDLKKFNFDLLTPRVRGGGGGSAGEIFSTMLLYFLIPMTSNMTMF